MAAARPDLLVVAAANASARDDLVADLVRRVCDVDGVRVMTPGPGLPADVRLAPAGPLTYGSRVSAADIDPAVLRLALMLGPAYRVPMLLGESQLTTAVAVLDRWRRLVAAWAETPSRRMPDSYVTRIRGAWCDDLDTARVLSTLTLLESDSAVEPGARFETFVWADRVLALELSRDVGR